MHHLGIIPLKIIFGKSPLHRKKLFIFSAAATALLYFKITKTPINHSPTAATGFYLEIYPYVHHPFLLLKMVILATTLFPHIWLILILSSGYTIEFRSFEGNFCGDEDTGNIWHKFVFLQQILFLQTSSKYWT